MRPQKKEQQRIKSMLAAMEVGDTAVSYTHLDVYKRQSEYCAVGQSGSQLRGNLKAWVLL